LGTPIVIFFYLFRAQWRPTDRKEEAGRLVITPVIVIPRDQAWFHTEEWQKEEDEP